MLLLPSSSDAPLPPVPAPPEPALTEPALIESASTEPATPPRDFFPSLAPAPGDDIISCLGFMPSAAAAAAASFPLH
jgi:hypothetical protein